MVNSEKVITSILKVTKFLLDSLTQTMSCELDNSHEALYKNLNTYNLERIKLYVQTFLLFGFNYPVFIFVCCCCDKRPILYGEKRNRVVQSLCNILLYLFFAVLVLRDSEKLSQLMAEMGLRNTANEVKLHNTSKVLLANTKTANILINKCWSILKVDTSKTESLNNIVNRLESLSKDMKEFSNALDIVHGKLIATKKEVIKDWANKFDGVPTNPYVREDINISCTLVIAVISFTVYIYSYARALANQRRPEFYLMSLLSLLLCTFIYSITDHFVYLEFTNTCKLDEMKSVNACTTGLWKNITNMDFLLHNFSKEFGAITELTNHLHLDRNDLLNRAINLTTKKVNHQQKSFNEFSNQTGTMLKTCNCSVIYYQFETLSSDSILTFPVFISGFILALGMLSFRIEWDWIWTQDHRRQL